MVITSSSGLGASTTTGVNGVAKRTSWEGDVWGGTLEGCDVSVPQTQRTLTDASTAQLQVPSLPSGSVRSFLLFLVTVPAECTEAAGHLFDWLVRLCRIRRLLRYRHDRQHPSPLRCMLILNPPSQNGATSPRRLPHYHPPPTFSDPIAYAFLSHTSTNTSTSADVDKCCPLH